MKIFIIIIFFIFFSESFANPFSAKENSLKKKIVSQKKILLKKN